MAVKNYLINDKWLDIDKQNTVEVKSTEGVIGSIKLNGEEYGGGGGESDFSMAEVTFSGTDGKVLATMPKIINTPFDAILPLQDIVNDETYTIALYKGKTIISLDLAGIGQNVTTSGDIELLEGETYLVTGDCTMTIIKGTK